MHAPRVDILVPTHHSKKAHLHAALDSALAQTVQNFRVIINDDPTEVDVASLVRPYLNDARFTFFRSPVKLGIGGNWNACMKHSTAPVVAYLFQDDTWDPKYLERALKILGENPTVGMVSLGHRYELDWQGKLNEAAASRDASVPKLEAGGVYKELKEWRARELREGRFSGRAILSAWINRELHPNFIGEPSFVVLRRSTIDEVGPFLEDMWQFLDSEYWIRCLQVTDWYFDPEELGAFRVHPDATTAKNEEEGKGIYDRLRCFEILIKSLPRGEMRESAIEARNSAFRVMVKKFLERRKSGKTASVKGGGSGAMKRFALRHPILVGTTLLKAMRG